MSIASLPTPLQHLSGRRFAFYPLIRRIAHNEWLYRRATGSECVVMNTLSGEEICVPRIFVGEITHVDEPVMLVKLSRELIWKDGLIAPYEHRVIQFPGPPETNWQRPAPVHQSGHLAPVVNIRLEPRREVAVWKWVGVAAVLGVVALGIVADIARQPDSRTRADTFRGYRGYLQLNAADDYAATIRKLGRPTTDRAVIERDVPGGTDGRAGDRRIFRALTYTQRQYAVILMGNAVPGTASHYIGALDSHGRVLDSVRLSDGASSESLLHSLATF